MDFIAIEFDKYDVWDAFIQPVPVKEEMYVQPDLQPEYVKLADWCSGPLNQDECVTGKRKKRKTIQAVPGLVGGGPGTGTDDPFIPSGGGGGLSEEQLACFHEQKEETEVDNTAQLVASEIRDQIASGLKDKKLEHGALIVEFDGKVYALPIVTGTEISIPFRTLTEGPSGLAANGLSFIHVIAVIHTHPSSTASSPEARVGDDAFIRGPSLGDLATAMTISQLGGGQDVSTYIISPDGDVLEYEGYDMPEWAQEGYTDDEIEDAIDEATVGNVDDAAGVCS